MSRIERSALVNFSAPQMYSLVNDIERYPEFMHGCSGAEILERGENFLTARLELNKAGTKQAFVTRNELNEPTSMTMKLIEGPFKKFSGRWQFDALKDDACKVTFSLDYEFANPLLGMLMKATFEKVASEQVNCLCERAKTIYA